MTMICIAAAAAQEWCVMKYRKKPVVIEAVQYTSDMTPPQWLVDAQAAGIFCQTKQEMRVEMPAGVLKP